MCDTGKLGSVVKAVFHFARMSNPHSVHLQHWGLYRPIDELTISEMLDRLRCILTECSASVIGSMYRRGVFGGMWVCIGMAVRVLRSRGASELAVVRNMVDTHTNHLSESYFLLFL